MMSNAATAGLLLWAVGTLSIRLAGNAPVRVFGSMPHTFGVYGASFASTGVLVPFLCAYLGIPRAAWFEAATLIALPTLVLDAFTCLFFTRVFPRLPATLAPKFGAWMMVCCAGGFVGVLGLR